MHPALEGRLQQDVVPATSAPIELGRQSEPEQRLLQIAESCALLQHPYPEVVVLKEFPMSIAASALHSCLAEHHRGVVHGVAIATEHQQRLMRLWESAGADHLS